MRNIAEERRPHLKARRKPDVTKPFDSLSLKAKATTSFEASEMFIQRKA
jgi:hypothetical protein